MIIQQAIQTYNYFCSTSDCRSLKALPQKELCETKVSLSFLASFESLKFMDIAFVIRKVA